MKYPGDRAGSHQIRYDGEVGRERSVGRKLRRSHSDSVVSPPRESACLQRGQQIDPLAGAKQFNGEDVAKIMKHAFQAAGPAHAHRNVILLIA